MRDRAPARPLLTTGVILGVGMGGFFDGIVLHQLLQWHHMLSSVSDYPMSALQGLEVNTTWDGIFHSVTWIATAVGLALLWRLERRFDTRWSRTLVGAMLMGWGGFNFVEGIVDHHILGIHHVRDDIGAPLGWDVAFLAWGWHSSPLATGWRNPARPRELRTVAAMKISLRSGAGSGLAAAF